MTDLTVILPTLNESENIRRMLEAVSEATCDIDTEILVVDDDSKDGTADIAMSTPVNARVIVRKTDHGLSQSVIEGFKEARGNIIVVMDCDFSHPVNKIKTLYEFAKYYDVVIGSRYMAGGGIGEWPVTRKIISIGATLFARLLFPDITDPVSGFFAVRKSVVSGVKFYPLGYKILMEVLGRGRWKTVKEIPYVFENRKKGGSKLGIKIIFNYIIHVLRLVLYGIRTRDSIINKEIKKILGFATVGVTGIFVNLMVFKSLLLFGMYDMLAVIISTEVSIINNFILNDMIVFGDAREHKFIRRFFSFQMISVVGFIMNTFFYAVLTRIFGFEEISALLLAIFIVFLYNFFFNRRLTWRS